jgi:hypothetical protein
MKRQPKRAKARRQAIQIYTYAQAQSVAPYLAAVVRSLRDHTVEALACRRRLARLEGRPGRPGRDALIARQDLERQAARAEDNLRDAALELQALDVYPLDPVRGQALVPFVHEEQLAWFVFDLFDEQPLQFWRFQTDPEDTRRPVTPRQHGRIEEAAGKA